MGYLKSPKFLVAAGLIIIMLASFLLMIFSSRGDSLTVDEKVHITSGYLHVWEGDYTFNSEHPPLLNDLAGLFAKIAKPNLPSVPLSNFEARDQWQYGDLFFYHADNDVDKIVFWARFPFILLTLGLIYLVFLWAKTIFSPKAGLVAAALVGFSPNIIAHGRLAATDFGLAFFFVLCIWLLRKYILKPNWPNAAWLGLSIGLVFLSKFSGILILPLIGLGLLYLWSVKRPKFEASLGQFLLIFISAFVLSWLVYAFSMRAELSSPLLMAPIGKFLQGYAIFVDHNTVGHWNFLNGQISFSGWWYYFPLVMWYKMTVPALILLGLAIIFPQKKKKFLENLLLILPPVLFLGVSLTSRIDIGIRHILPVLPFVFIFISGLVETKNLFLKPIVTGLVILHVAFGILAYPNFISYFNQIAGGPSGGINHLIDSNLDWNQNMKRFAAYAKDNNIDKVYTYCWDTEAFRYYGVEAEFLPTTPVNGVVVICAHQLKIKYGYDFSWVEKYPVDEIVAQTMYVWRFDKNNIQFN